MSAAARFLLLSAGAVLSAALVAVVLTKDVDNLGIFLLSLVPFVLATEAIAVLPTRWVRHGQVQAALGVLAFLVVYAGFVPRMFGSFLDESFDGFYELVRVFTPYLILALALVLRLGGGQGRTVRRLSYAALLVMLSGLEDLMFWVWQGESPPELWTWADHITVRLGHVATLGEAVALMTVHLLLAAGMLLVPDRWWDRLTARLLSR